MSAEPRPWWASDGPVHGDVDREVDPVTAHRAGRRGGAGPEEDQDEPDGGDDAAAAARDGPDGTDDATDDATGPGDRAVSGDHPTEICGVCPICVAARSLGESRPELLGHLAEAARHLAAAARTLLDPPEPPGGPGDGGIQRIDLD